ncbi:glycosyltransferase family 4 protein [Nostoc sp. PA-18-2419]|uniref:glycosyltransferase family 4 protein n=1 Tax=Nostoc sp. PA-18-2419 TaxID=2575443 RepID=UPI001CB937BD|nr:glycosyltransferase family 4 protein [Nostoc sp. PA-18-2419]
MENIKSIFLPKAFVEGNPYITQLTNNLETVGIELALPSLSSSTTFFFPLVFLREKADFVHLHWLDPFFTYPNQFNLLKLLIVVFQLVLLKLFGIKIVWTVHNLKNHESINFIYDRIYSIVIGELSNAIITHCQVAKEQVVKEFYIRNKQKVFVVPHGNYIDFYENKIEKATAREKLGLKDSNLVFLFLGSIRPYKGVFELIDTFNQLDSDTIQLVIAGRVHNDSQEITDILRQKIVNDQRIKFFPGFVPNDEVQLYMNACDVVIFPYREILTSGAVLLAMSFGKACIAPREGCIGDVLDNAGAFLYEMDDENGLTKAMNSALDKHHELFIMGRHNLQLAEEYNWKHIAKMTADVYRYCL